MACPADDSQRHIFPFLQLPPEIRTNVYHRCGTMELGHDVPRPWPHERGCFATPQLCFDPRVLNLCRQIRQEASALLLPETLTVVLEVSIMPPPPADDASKRKRKRTLSSLTTSSTFVLPVPLHELLPYAGELPSRRYWIERKSLPKGFDSGDGDGGRGDGNGVLAPMYRIQIHRFVDSARRFSKLEGLRVGFLRFEVQMRDLKVGQHRSARRRQVSGCIDRLSGIHVTTSDGPWTEGLGRLMRRRPKVAGEAGDGTDAAICQCGSSGPVREELRFAHERNNSVGPGAKACSEHANPV